MAVQVLVELKLGIDPTISDLQSDNPGEYWLETESGALVPTFYPGDIPGNYWKNESDSLTLNQSGTTSRYWELIGNSLTVKLGV